MRVATEATLRVPITQDTRESVELRVSLGVLVSSPLSYFIDA